MATQNMSKNKHGEPDLNPDPITGSSGSHPIGTGIGAASGAASGAAVGAIGGPIGAIIGGISGAIVGGLIGHGIGEAVDPTEDEYWREEHTDRPYYAEGRSYEDYEPAYRLGYNAADANVGDNKQIRQYDDAVDSQLREHYGKYRGDSELEWDEAREAVREAYQRRMERRRSGATA